MRQTKKKMLDFSNLTINCNRLGKIFSKNSECITEKELERINELLAKEKIKPLTEKEIDRLDALLEKKSESDPHIIAKAAQLYLLFLYVLKKYGRQPKLFTDGDHNPYAQNGILKEPQSLRLIGQLSGIELYRNKKKFKSEYLSGQFDAFDTPELEDSEKIYEVKTTSNIYKFLQAKRYPLTKDVILQMQGYLALSGKDTGEINFCLVDFPESVILEQRAALFKYLCPDGIETNIFLTEWRKMENSLRFSNIPDRDRVFAVAINRDEKTISQIYKKVRDCRKWLNDFALFNEKVIGNGFVDANKVRF